MLDLKYFRTFVEENPGLIKELYEQGLLSSGEISLVEQVIPGIFSAEKNG